MAKKGGRPKVQHIKHVHIIELSPAAEEAITDFREAYLFRGFLRAAGRALQGALSHPVGWAGILGLFTALWFTYGPGRQSLEAAVKEKGVTKSVIREIAKRSPVGAMVTTTSIALSALTDTDVNTLENRFYDMHEAFLRELLRVFGL